MWKKIIKKLTNWYYTSLLDDEKHEENDGRSADSTPGFCSYSEKLENEREDEEEQTNVFGDTVESLLRITLPSGWYIANVPHILIIWNWYDLF